MRPDDLFKGRDNWQSIALNILWRGLQREASLHLLPSQPAFSGMVGTALLKYQVVTVEVVEGGTVIVDSANSRPEHRRTLWRPSRRRRQRPMTKNEDEYWKWAGSYLPWTNLQVQDRVGNWHTVWVSVDTGDSGELSLPASWITRLGLILSEESKIRTPFGRATVNCGEARIKWQGKEKLVECQHREGHPPLVGMKLLEGHRITIDFTYPRPETEIGRIPRSSWSKKGLVDSIADLFRFANRGST